MEKPVNENLDLTPLFSEIFKTQACVRALAAVTLKKKQKKEYDKKYSKILDDIITEFEEQYPGIIKMDQLQEKAETE